MKLTLLPLQNDDVIRVRSEGLVSQRQSGDPLLDLLGPNRYTHRVLLNLDRTPGIDTSGLCWLVSSHKLFTQAGGRLVLTGVPPVILDVLDFLRLTPLLHIAMDEQEASELIADSGRSPLVAKHPFESASRLTR
jgi:anti-anti-sigma regulatory factor